jgi:histidinol dehydrogenase
MSEGLFRPHVVADPEALPAPLRARLVAADYGIPAEIDASVAAIIEDVRARGDEALVDLTARFDGVTLTPETLRVSREELAGYAEGVDHDLAADIATMIERVRYFHGKQHCDDVDLDGDDGETLALHYRPLRSVGVYVPGGLAAYPTTVVMNVVPAQIAGVPRIVAFTPPATLRNNPAVAYALVALGVDEVYAVGGAQAVAAAAWGTEHIAPVDKIVGPGNAYVAAAKRQVFGKVGIDSIAGPSEVVVVAAAGAPPEWIALDLMAQAEHDESARVVLLTPSEELAWEVAAAIEERIGDAPRAGIIGAALHDHGANVVLPSLADCVALCNRIAPEHLQVIVDDEAGLMPADFVAGAIFWGEHTPTAVGDYWAGPNHVLPTGTTARYRGPLGVADFTVPYSVVRYTKKATTRLDGAIRLAEAEGLAEHAAALRARWEDATQHEG